MPDERTPRQIAEENSERIRDAAKWLVASFAAVGAALIAGSQLSSIGKLPACWDFTATCLRLPVALGGSILALAGVAWAVWTAVLLLVPNTMPISDLKVAWEKGGEKSPLQKYFRANPVYMQGFKDLSDVESTEQTAYAAFDKLEAAYDAAKDDAERDRIAGEMEVQQAEINDILARSEAVVSSANFVLLSNNFKSRALWRLLAAAVVAALGIGIFAWASNPPSQPKPVVMAKLDLAGIDLSGAQLRNADLSGTNLSDGHLVATDLREADLSGADLTRADLTAANLQGADLTNAALADVVWDATTCPDGENSDQVGGSCEAHM
jgi:hypothetical protein